MSQTLAASTYRQPPMTASKSTIERLAIDAAQQGLSLNHACPYPFASEAAMHFKAAYLLALPRTTTAATQKD